MNLRNLRLTFMISILLFSLVVSSPALSAVDVQEKDLKAYKQAYNLILGEKWEQAEKALSKFVSMHRRSAWADDARFWMCYAKEKLDHPLEDVFSCYQKFIKAYSSSKWVDDAKANLVRIGHVLSKRGKPEYEAILKSMQENEEEEVKLAALYALEDMGDEQALEAIIKLYDTSKSQKLRARIINIFEDFESPVAFVKIKEIALQDSDPYLRRRAVFVIREVGNKEAVEVLMTIVKTDSDAKVKKTAITLAVASYFE